MPFLEASGITKRYTVGGTELTVLRDLALTVGAGEMVAIVGASGVGKSTLLHILGGLDRASEGRVSAPAATLHTPAQQKSTGGEMRDNRRINIDATTNATHLRVSHARAKQPGVFA